MEHVCLYAIDGEKGRRYIYAEHAALMAIAMHHCYFQNVNLNIWLSVKGLINQDARINSKNLNGTDGKVNQ